MGFLRREKKNERQQHGRVVEAVVRKKSEKVKYGIVFHRSKSSFPTTIESIRPGGVFHRSGLLPGMYVLEVNGEEATWQCPKYSARLLKNAPVGSDLSIKAAIPKTIEVNKDSQETSWGFSIKNSTNREGFFVDNVAPDSLIASSGLERGMMILKINGETFPNGIKEAAKALRASRNSLEMIVVQLETAVDIDIDACGTDTGIREDGDEIESSNQQERKTGGGDNAETRDEGEPSHKLQETARANAKEERDKVDSAHQKQTTPVLQTVAETHDGMKIPQSSGASQNGQAMVDDLEIDMDEFSYVESENHAPLEGSQIPSQTDENNSSGWYFKRSKEEECFDLDDGFPERYTKNNNSLFQSVLPASKRESRSVEVMSQVMQLRKLRQPIPKNSIATSPPEASFADVDTEERNAVMEKKKKFQWRSSKPSMQPHDDDTSSRRALLFGLKKESQVATLPRFNPQGRRPRFFKGPSLLSAKSRSDRVATEERLAVGTNTSNVTPLQSMFGRLFSCQDQLCGTFGSFPGSTNDTTCTVGVHETKTESSVTSKRRVTRFRKQKAAAEDLREIEEVLEL